MYNYFDLNQRLQRDTQSGKLKDLIAELESEYLKSGDLYLVTLFLARAYDRVGDVNKATDCYQHFVDLAASRITRSLLDEVRDFASRYNLRDLSVPEPGRLRSVTPLGVSEKGLAVRPSDSLPIPPNVSGLLSKGGDALQRGQLTEGLAYFKQAYDQGARNAQVFLGLAQSLQRIGRHRDAVAYLDFGIRTVKEVERARLLNLKAQILSSQDSLDDAAHTYQDLLRLEHRPAARRFVNLQLARIYQKVGDTEKARAVLETVLKTDPVDAVALTMLAALDASISHPSTDEFRVDLPDEGIDLISPMLRSDLAQADFRDREILLRGGQPTPSDANRLLQEAEKNRGSEFGERYPAFLEAAKAFNVLPEGTYEVEKFHRALARYAMLKGGALVSEFRGRIASGQVDLSELRRVRDSATSYYLEALALQVQVDQRYVLPFLSNLLRVQVAFAVQVLLGNIPQNLFTWDFARLFTFCLDHKDEDLLRIPYEAVVTFGAASTQTWNRLSQIHGGPRIMYVSLGEESKRGRPYGILAAMSGDKFDVSKRPGEVLKAAFLARRRQNQAILSFLASIQQIQLTVQNVRELHDRWRNFPQYQGPLLDTDREIQAGISGILTTLLPYQSRTAEERTAILFEARTQVEALLGRIEVRPTYWGRTGFELLLRRWQSSIRTIEKQRLRELEPVLTASLEPSVFHVQGNDLCGGLRLTNVGRATASGAELSVEVMTYSERRVVHQLQLRIENEIPVSMAHDCEVRIPIPDLPEGVAVPYRMIVTIAPVFRDGLRDARTVEFMVEIASGERIGLRDIPWSEIRIPPEHLFKGREDLINRLVSHLQSPDRNKTYILFGLTRTGKSSILTYLSRKIDLVPVEDGRDTFRMVSFQWDLAKARAQSDARDMWGYLLEAQVIGKLQDLARRGLIDASIIPAVRHPGSARFSDWERLLNSMREQQLLPVFLVDEFSYYRELVNSHRIDASFLAAIRSFAIYGQASFVFAGTYDLRKIIRDPAYGITGQLVNAIEEQVSRIDPKSAAELVRAMEPKLTFTSDAIDHILHLSYRIPYFIQLLCKNCGMYAVGAGRSVIGFPDVESVVKALTGEKDQSGIPEVQRLAPGVFMNNMETPIDPPEYRALISTICHLTRDQARPRLVTYPEIQEVWHRHGVPLFQARLAQAIHELKDREVLIADEDEGLPAYRLSVDLFRRWWGQEHKYLNIVLDAIKGGNN